MNQPRPPKQPAARRQQSTDPATYIALFFLLLFAGGFLILLGVVTGIGVLFVPVLIIGAVLLGLFHYVVWGWALTKLLRDDTDSEAFEEAP